MVLDSITDSSDEVIECNVNDVLEKLEPGYFHYMMLMICGMAFMADAMVSWFVCCSMFCLAE